MTRRLAIIGLLLASSTNAWADRGSFLDNGDIATLLVFALALLVGATIVIWQVGKLAVRAVKFGVAVRREVRNAEPPLPVARVVRPDDDVSRK